MKISRENFFQVISLFWSEVTAFKQNSDWRIKVHLQNCWTVRECYETRKLERFDKPRLLKNAFPMITFVIQMF